MDYSLRYGKHREGQVLERSLQLNKTPPSFRPIPNDSVRDIKLSSRFDSKNSGTPFKTDGSACITILACVVTLVKLLSWLSRRFLAFSILKFGGTSVGTGERLIQVSEIVKTITETHNPIVVVSAMSGVKKSMGTTSR